MKKRLLLAPGPTPVPPEVLLRMAEPMIHHRTPQFSQILAETSAMLRELYQTEQPVLMISGSGSASRSHSTKLPLLLARATCCVPRTCTCA